MKKIILLILTIATLSCSEANQESVKKPSEQKIEKIIEFPHYPSITQMLKTAGDFKEEDGTLKILSKNEEIVHVQVSKLTFEGDSDDLLIEQTKRDIIYVAYQVFAETDAEEVIITSVPVQMKDFKTIDKYLEKFKETKRIKKEDARKIMTKYLNISDFKELYELKGGEMWLPNKQFSNLKFKNLNNIFSELK